MKAIVLFQIQLKDILKNLQVLLLFLVFPMIGFVMSSSLQDQSSFFIIIFATMHVVFTPMMVMTTILSEQKQQKIIRNLAYASVPSYIYLFVHGCLITFLTLLSVCSFLMFPGFTQNLFSFILASLLGILLSVLFGACIALSTSSMSSASAIVMPFAMLFSFVPMLAQFHEGFQQIANILYSKQISMMMENIHHINGIGLMVLSVSALFLIVWFYYAYRKSLKEEN